MSSDSADASAPKARPGALSKSYSAVDLAPPRGLLLQSLVNDPDEPSDNGLYVKILFPKDFPVVYRMVLLDQRLTVQEATRHILSQLSVPAPRPAGNYELAADDCRLPDAMQLIDFTGLDIIEHLELRLRNTSGSADQHRQEQEHSNKQNLRSRTLTRGMSFLRRNKVEGKDNLHDRRRDSSAQTAEPLPLGAFERAGNRGSIVARSLQSRPSSPDFSAGAGSAAARGQFARKQSVIGVRTIANHEKPLPPALETAEGLELSHQVLLDNPRFADVEISVGDDADGQGFAAKIFRAHWCIIRSRSPALAELARLNSGQKYRIDSGLRHAMSVETMESVLHYIYTGALDWPRMKPELAVYVNVAAEVWRLPRLEWLTAEFVKSQLTKTSVFVVLKLAREFDRLDMRNQAILFACDNFNELIRSPKFKKLPVEIVQEIVTAHEDRSCIHVPTESDAPPDCMKSDMRHLLISANHSSRDSSSSISSSTDGLSADIRFRIGAEIFGAHKAILSAFSEGTSQLVSKPMRRTKQQTVAAVSLDDYQISGRAFHKLLRYIYYLDVGLDPHSAFEILNFLRDYPAPRLQVKCEDVLFTCALTADSVLMILDVTHRDASGYSAERRRRINILKSAALRFSREHFTELFLQRLPQYSFDVTTSLLYDLQAQQREHQANQSMQLESRSPFSKQLREAMRSPFPDQGSPVKSPTADLHKKKRHHKRRATKQNVAESVNAQYFPMASGIRESAVMADAQQEFQRRKEARTRTSILPANGSNTLDTNNFVATEHVHGDGLASIETQGKTPIQRTAVGTQTEMVAASAEAARADPSTANFAKLMIDQPDCTVDESELSSSMVSSAESRANVSAAETCENVTDQPDSTMLGSLNSVVCAAETREDVAVAEACENVKIQPDARIDESELSNSVIFAAATCEDVSAAETHENVTDQPDSTIDEKELSNSVVSAAETREEVSTAATCENVKTSGELSNFCSTAVVGNSNEMPSSQAAGEFIESVVTTDLSNKFDAQEDDAAFSACSSTVRTDISDKLSSDAAHGSTHSHPVSDAAVPCSNDDDARGSAEHDDARNVQTEQASFRTPTDVQLSTANVATQEAACHAQVQGNKHYKLQDNARPSTTSAEKLLASIEELSRLGDIDNAPSPIEGLSNSASPVVPTTETHVVCKYSYQDDATDHLRITKGQVLEVLRPRRSGWWVGRTGSGEIGKFPINYCCELADLVVGEANSAVANLSVAVSSSSSSEQEESRLGNSEKLHIDNPSNIGASMTTQEVMINPISQADVLDQNDTKLGDQNPSAETSKGEPADRTTGLSIDASQPLHKPPTKAQRGFGNNNSPSPNVAHDFEGRKEDMPSRFEFGKNDTADQRLSASSASEHASPGRLLSSSADAQLSSGDESQIAGWKIEFERLKRIPVSEKKRAIEQALRDMEGDGFRRPVRDGSQELLGTSNLVREKRTAYEQHLKELEQEESRQRELMRQRDSSSREKQG